MTPVIPDLRGLVAQAPPEELPALAGRLAEAQAMLTLRLTTPTPNGNGRPQPEAERMLTPEEALEIIGGSFSRKWLLRHTKGLRFRRDLSRKAVRFEESGLRRWLAAKRA